MSIEVNPLAEDALNDLMRKSSTRYRDETRDQPSDVEPAPPLIMLFLYQDSSPDDPEIIEGDILTQIEIKAPYTAQVAVSSPAGISHMRVNVSFSGVAMLVDGEGQIYDEKVVADVPLDVIGHNVPGHTILTASWRLDQASFWARNLGDGFIPAHGFITIGTTATTSAGAEASERVRLVF
jgi:hypothetical protein